MFECWLNSARHIVSSNSVRYTGAMKNEMALEELYIQITKLESYTPTPKVDELFSALVAFVLNNKEENVSLTQTQRKKLQQISAKAEFELEWFWAQKISTSIEPKETLQNFPYIKNYQKLTALEWNALQACCNQVFQKALFVGGGPLPLSAILLAQHYKQEITILDNDEEACRLAERVISVLGLEKSVKIIHTDANEYLAYGDHTVIFVAALAGVDEVEKSAIVSKIKKLSVPHTHILLRSSWGSRKLLYPAVHASQFAGLEHVIEIRPEDDVINSILIVKN